MGPLELQSLESMRKILEVNLLGTIQTIQAFLPDMKARGKGHILVTGSAGGLHGEIKECLKIPFVQARVESFFFQGLMEILNVYASVMLEIAKIMFPPWSGAGLPFNEVYCASKFAIEGACESLAILLQHFNIQSVSNLIQRGIELVRE